MSSSSFGLIGLGVMGSSLAKNVLGHDIPLSVYNRDSPSEAHMLTNFLEENKDKSNLKGFSDLGDFVASLTSPCKILLMVSAGAAVDSVIDSLLPYLESGDILLDGGNSHFQDTERRSKQLQKSGIQYLGCGISGGEEGALKGPSIMPGGERTAYDHVAGVLEEIAARDKSGLACCSYVGAGGAGNFVKMIHNGIEYGEMQLLAECYHVMKQFKTNQEIAQVFDEWNKTTLSSYLCEITAQILRKKEGDSDLVDLILDKASNKGTGSWSSQTALANGMPTTMMTDAVFARYLSTLKSTRISLADKISVTVPDAQLDENVIKAAYQFARLINHQQGFALIQELSDRNDWNVNLSETARIWTNGCIIRSSLMERLVILLKEGALIDQEEVVSDLSQGENAVIEYLNHTQKMRIPSPAISSAYQYWVGLSTASLPANLIQAQRDFFGAHTYERIDGEPGVFHHTNW